MSCLLLSVDLSLHWWHWRGWGRGVDSRGRLVLGCCQLPLEIWGQIIDQRVVHVRWVSQILEAVRILWTFYSRAALGVRGVWEEEVGRKQGGMVWIRPFMQLGEDVGLEFSASPSAEPPDLGFLQLLP